MTKEVKSIFLVTVTLFLYGISMLFSNGAVVFPYPLNPFIFIVVAIQFSIWHRQKALAWLIVLTALMSCLGSIIIWETLLPFHRLNSFVETIWLDVFKLLYLIGIVAWGIFTAIQQKSFLYSSLTIAGLISLILGEINENQYLTIFGWLILMISTQIKKVSAPFQLLWLLLFILESTTFITVWLNQ